MKIYDVRYEVRLIGSIGVFWSMDDYVYAENEEQAKDNFQEMWNHKYEFRPPIHAKLLAKETSIRMVCDNTCFE